jgi:hypothetical protein
VRSEGYNTDCQDCDLLGYYDEQFDRHVLEESPDLKVEIADPSKMLAPSTKLYIVISQKDVILM